MIQKYRFRILIFLLALVFQSKAQNELLNTPVSVNVVARTPDEILEVISQQCHCYFTYNSELITPGLKLSLSMLNVPLIQVLDSVFKKPGIQFQQLKNQIIALPLKSTPVQEVSSTNFRIKGKITDENSQEPLPYTSIALKHSLLGTISNADGKFSLVLAEKNQNDTLIFSFIGYAPLYIPVCGIDTFINIGLRQESVSIQEIVVRSKDALAILHEAINNMNAHFQLEETSFEVFYREGVWRKNSLVEYSEAQLWGYFPAHFYLRNSHKVSLNKSRKIARINLRDTVWVKIQAGLESCFMLDLSRHKPDFLTESSMENYNYRISDITTRDNQLCYIIEFSQKDYITEPLFEGEIFIRVDDYAILAADFAFTKKRLIKSENMFVLKKSNRIKVEPQQTRYMIEYRQWNNKLYLNHVRAELELKVRHRRKLLNEHYSTLMEIVFTSLDTVNITRPTRAQLCNTKTIFSNQTATDHTEFWQNSTIITPELESIKLLKKSGYLLETKE